MNYKGILFNKYGVFTILFAVLLLSACGVTYVVGNPTAADFLKDGNADIFVLDGIVFSNEKDEDWVRGLDYTIGKEIGEITNQTSKVKDFKDNTANILPIGTKIYETDTEVYIAIVNGEEIPYLKMLEG